jgi:hypothetical protein
MTALVWTARGLAVAFSAGIDADFGFPIDGCRNGGGVHVTRAGGRTTRYASVDKHRTLNQWAYQEDGVIVAKEARVPIGTGLRQTLDATWDDRIPDG